ncbi:hypothetical protein ACFE04_024370 [Oxalis oulophora]
MALKLMLMLVLLVEASNCLANNNTNPLRWSNKNGEEQDYLDWVRKLPSVKHSLFQEAKNKLRPCLTIKVSKTKKKSSSSSSKKFHSVQSAINSLPLVNTCRVRIFVGPGTYREKVVIPETMGYITMEGAGVGKTVIEWDDTVDTQPLGTYGSATFAVNSPYFIAKNITFKKCHLHATAGTYGALTAQKRESMLEDTGFSFFKCRVTGSGVLYLGRAWGTFSRVVFAYTYMEKIITPRGWYNWGDKSREM